MEDDLSEWVSKLNPSFFMPVDATHFPSLAIVSTWAKPTWSTRQLSSGTRFTIMSAHTNLSTTFHYVPSLVSSPMTSADVGSRFQNFLLTHKV